MWRNWDIQRGMKEQDPHPRSARVWNDMGVGAWTLATAVISLTIFLPCGVEAQKSVTPTAELPAGPMQAKATTTCTECHEARIILQQRLSKAAWGKEVDKMVKWGAVVDAADRDALIDYLSTNFSPDKPAYEPPKTSDKVGKPAQ
jgi:hypothetical protein